MHTHVSGDKLCENSVHGYAIRSHTHIRTHNFRELHRRTSSLADWKHLRNNSRIDHSTRGEYFASVKPLISHIIMKIMSENVKIVILSHTHIYMCVCVREELYIDNKSLCIQKRNTQLFILSNDSITASALSN